MQENRFGRKKHSSNDYDPEYELQEIDNENHIFANAWVQPAGSKSLGDLVK